MLSAFTFCDLRSYTSRRNIYTTIFHLAKAYTRESRPIPGSEEHKDPNKWARRLFKLKENKTVSITSEEPPLLHMICRLKPLKGLIHYQKALLEKYGLGKEVKNHTWVVVKNTPSVNEELDHIKHCIRIQPIYFTDGVPCTSDDLTRCRLLPNGHFYKGKGISVDAELVDATDSSSSKENSVPHMQLVKKAQQPRGYLTRRYLRQWHNQRWDNHELFNELFASHYKYKLNQDGKEYRYSQLWKLDNALYQSVQNQRNPDGTRKQPNSNRFDADWNTYPWAKY